MGELYNFFESGALRYERFRGMIRSIQQLFFFAILRLLVRCQHYVADSFSAKPV